MLPMLELQPVYYCTNATVANYPCKAVDFCDKPGVTHTIDWNDKASLHNWVESQDLACN